jgi:Leucine-rich repeat (LRR) protein
MTTAIETYLNSLSEDISELNVNNKGIKSLPNLTRFKNLEVLDCDNNQLTSLPTLPQNIEKLYCYNNKLTSLPTLPQNLKVLICFHNQLTSLPTLPQKLETLYCSSNKLNLLPTLPQKLETLYCSHNQLNLLPTLPQNLEKFNCVNNPIYEIVSNNSLFQIKQNIQILNNFRHLYYCLKFKKQFRKWLWEKVREPIVKKLYSPNYLIENLKEEDDLDTVLDNWK